MAEKKVVVVLPAYNARKTLRKTIQSIPEKYLKNIILVDDNSSDDTVKLAKKLNIKVFTHKKNLGYGGNQKTCYKEALKEKADIIVMLHPDYQYPPECITPMVELIETGFYDCVLGSRILVNEAKRGGMPIYKYYANRLLTLAENILVGAKLSEYHTGLRAYKSSVLKDITFQKNSDDFIFDNQVILQIISHGYRIGEISSPCRYDSESSSINFIRSSVYGLGCLYWGFMYYLGRMGLYKHPLIFS